MMNSIKRLLHITPWVALWGLAGCSGQIADNEVLGTTSSALRVAANEVKTAGLFRGWLFHRKRRVYGPMR